MLPLYYTELRAFREIIISRATSGGRREIELNSGSLPPIPGGLATLAAGQIRPAKGFQVALEGQSAFLRNGSRVTVEKL